MMSAEVMIQGRPIKAIWIGAGLIVLSLCYTAYTVFFADDPSVGVMAHKAAIESEVDDLNKKQDEANQLKVKTKQVDQIKSEILALQQSVQLLRQKIPTDVRLPALLYDIEHMAKSSDNTLNSFEPGTLKPFSSTGAAQPGASTSDIQEMPIHITASATYTQVIKFLQQIAAYERKLNVKNLSLTPAGGGRGVSGDNSGNTAFSDTLNVDFTLSAYVLNGAAMAPVPMPSAPRRRRR